MKTIPQLSLILLSLSLASFARADTIIVEGNLDVEGVLTIGNSEQSDDQLSAGTMRWTSSAFEFYDGVSWKKIPISVFADDGSARWGSDKNSVSGSYSTVWGFENTVSGTNASAWGRLNQVGGNFSNAWGFENTANGINVTAWGKKNTASGNFSTVWGFENTANGNFSTVWGFENTASGNFSTVWGFNSNADGDFSTAWGRYANAPSIMSTALGKFNIGSFSFSSDGDDTNDGNSTWFSMDPLLEIGIGGNDLNRANALTLLKNGRIALGRHTTLSALQTEPETVQVQGALKVGDYATDPGANASEGAIRYGDDGSGSNDLFGYVDGNWKSLTQIGGSGDGTDQTLSIDGNQLTISGAGGNTVTLPGSGVTGGTNGQDGAVWLTGAGIPDDADGVDGDLYLDTSNGDYYVKASGTWGSSSGNLTGPQGVAGADGAVGPQGPAGASPFVLNVSDVHFTGGNVGIGVTTPTEALDVAGNAKISGQLSVEGSLLLTSHAGDIPTITY